MTSAVKRVPEEFHTMTPHLVVKGVAQAVEFYRRAFGAEELFRNLAPDGETIIHSELLLGDSRFFLNDEFPEHGVVSPEALNGSPGRSRAASRTSRRPRSSSGRRSSSRSRMQMPVEPRKIRLPFERRVLAEPRDPADPLIP